MNYHLKIKRYNVVRMKISENLARVFQDEVERVCHERMLLYAQSISTIHNIPLKLLLRDLPNPGGYCLGIKKGGQPCTRKASHDGFCLSHVNSTKLHEPVNVGGTARHNHPLPPLFKPGCPACESSSSNQFRDLRLMM
jgi:hypothetical protein